MSDQMQEASETSSAASRLLHPIDAVRAAARQVPGATAIEETFDGVLDAVGLVSPRTRRIAAYAGAGLLGAVGVVEWPAAAAGAAAVWLTQARPTRADDSAAAKTPPSTTGATRRATAEPSARKRAVGKT